MRRITGRVLMVDPASTAPTPSPDDPPNGQDKNATDTWRGPQGETELH